MSVPYYKVALVLPTEHGFGKHAEMGVRSAAEAIRALERGTRFRTPWVGCTLCTRTVLGHMTLREAVDATGAKAVIFVPLDDALPNGTPLGATANPVLPDVPAVQLFAAPGPVEMPCIRLDEAATGRLAAAHLLDRGLRHFAFVGLAQSDGSLSPACRLRVQAFRTEIRPDQRPPSSSPDADLAAPAISSHGGNGDAHNLGHLLRERSYSEFICPAGEDGVWPRPALEADLARWLADLPKPIGILADRDVVAACVLQVARLARLRVPEQIAVLGVGNDEPLCESAAPPLSSIQTGAFEAGRQALLLVDRLVHQLPTKPIADVPPVKVVARRSTDVMAVEDPELAMALRYIQTEATRALTVKGLMELIPVNRRTLERKFIEVLGRTPLQEIHRVRLERAKALLEDGASVNDAARQSGFINIKNLRRAFREAYGLNPSSFHRSQDLSTGR